MPLVAGCGGGETPAQTVKVPAEYKSYFTVAARRCPGVLTPPGLAAMAYVESRFQSDAESGNGAQGLMQILPSVFRQYGIDANGDGKKDVFTPADAIATSAAYSWPRTTPASGRCTSSMGCRRSTRPAITSTR